MTTFHLQIYTPDRLFFDGETENLIVRTTVGDKGILARHEPYVAALPIGKLKIKLNGEFRTAAVSEGVVKVSKDKTVILVQSCEWADEIDLPRAEHAREAAEAKLSRRDLLSSQELAIAEAKLKRALVRSSVAGRK